MKLERITGPLRGAECDGCGDEIDVGDAVLPPAFTDGQSVYCSECAQQLSSGGRTRCRP